MPLRKSTIWDKSILKEEFPVDKKEFSDFARTIPFFFLGIVGLIYASGFLVVTTHLETLGIRDVGSELWKSRYVHIGVLSLAFPAMIVSTTYGIFAMNSLRKAGPEYLTFNSVKSFINLFTVLTLGLTFYSFAMFVRRPSSPVEAVPVFLTLMLTVGVGALALVAWLERHYKGMAAPQSRFWLSIVIGLRLAVLITVLVCSLEATGAGYWRLIMEICRYRWHALLLMAACWFSVGYYVFALKYWGGSRLAENQRALAWVLCASVAGPMYYISLMAFAYSLFPYIPATRGGGDYSVTHVANISIKSPEKSDAGPLFWIPGGIVEETPSTVYVIEEGKWHPCAWRKTPRTLPQPKAISRDQIITIEYPENPDQPSEGFTSNPNNNGVYQMDVGAVPFDKVKNALSKKHRFTGDVESSRYHKDLDYDKCSEAEE
jgi:hypothetical protein